MEKKENKVTKRTAKEANEANKEKDQTTEKEGVSTIEEALDRIRKDPKANSTLRELRRSGFDEGVPGALVFSFCGGTVEMARAGLKKAKSFATQLENCAKQLEISADSVRAIEGACEKRGSSLGPEDLPERMQDLAQRMRKKAAPIKKGLRTIRLGVKNQADRRGEVTLTSGRDFILVYLAYLIAGGNKPSIGVYRQIAHLVAAVSGELNPDYEKIAGRLRKDVERFLSRAVHGSWVTDQAKHDFEVLRNLGAPFRT